MTVIKVTNKISVNLDQVLFSERMTIPKNKYEPETTDVVRIYFRTGGAGGDTYNHGVINVDVPVEELTEQGEYNF